MLSKLEFTQTVTIRSVQQANIGQRLSTKLIVYLANVLDVSELFDSWRSCQKQPEVGGPVLSA